MASAKSSLDRIIERNSPLKTEVSEDMERTPVESSAVISLGYESDTETLEIEFASGHVYQYRNVPQPIYDEMLQAPSLGQFVNASIRPVYPYEKV